MSKPPHVFLTGAGGRTGALVLQKLRSRGIQVTGMVRREEQSNDIDIILGDVLQPETYEEAMSNCNVLIILTSAMPRSRPPANPSDPPEWFFDPGQEPEQVDWIGQRNQIDLASKYKYDRVILVSSMGVKKPDHPLNRIGNGKILFWKHTSEEYLINSGLDYTIVHPGGLIDKPGGQRELVVGRNDSLLESQHRSIPREDVAEVVVQALLWDEAINKDFDIVSLPESQGEPTKDFKVLFDLA